MQAHEHWVNKPFYVLHANESTHHNQITHSLPQIQKNTSVTFPYSRNQNIASHIHLLSGKHLYYLLRQYNVVYLPLAKEAECH